MILRVSALSRRRMTPALKSFVERAASTVGYDKTHITRTVAYAEVGAFLAGLPVGEMDAL